MSVVPSRKSSVISEIPDDVDSETTGGSDFSDPADGEYDVLLESLEDSSPPLTATVEEELMHLPSKGFWEDLKRTMSGRFLWTKSSESMYGKPLSEEEAKERVPPNSDGLGWYATIIPDEFFKEGKLARGLNRRDFDVDNRSIKPCRPSLPVTASDFFSSLTKVDGPDGPRYIFSGVLNGWPSLRCFELVSLEQRRQASAIPTPKELVSGQILWTHVWKAEQEGKSGIEPELQDHHRVHRAKLRGASWSARGWSKESPGFAFWYEAQTQPPKMTYGTNMVKTLGDEKCTMIHMVSHRYAKERESPRDKLTYHSICLLEWENGNFCTVIEAAFLNGIGGYKGKSNWYDDRDEPVSELYSILPPEMVCPWRTTSAEIRCYDVPAKSFEEFKHYVDKYTGKTKRFVDPQFTFSHRARLSFRTKAHIAQYLLNYIGRDSAYAELKRNCQTFTADLCSFIAGKKDIVPFHPVSRVDYHNRTYLFLYDSDMYHKKSSKQKRQSTKT